MSGQWIGSPTVQLSNCPIARLGWEWNAAPQELQSNVHGSPTAWAVQLSLLSNSLCLLVVLRRGDHFFIPRFVLIGPVGKECWPDWPDWVIGAIVTDQPERPTVPHEARKEGKPDRDRKRIEIDCHERSPTRQWARLCPIGHTARQSCQQRAPSQACMCTDVYWCTDVY